VRPIMTRRECFVLAGAGFSSLACRVTRPAAVRFADEVSGEFRAALAVSLRGLAASVLRSGWGSPRLANLGGLNRLAGVSVESDGDVYLMGEASAAPQWHVDDLAIALRSAFHAGSAYQEPIGCTIDPREGAEDPWTMQVARTFGIEPSAMAARHVAIDYEMKKASLGLVVLKPGMPTLMDSSDSVSNCAASVAPAKEATQTAHRFWFCPRVPDTPRFVRDGDAIWIHKPVGAQVLTEQEFLDSKAHRVGAKAADGSALAFAAAMTKLLEAGDLPQYAALKADFRLIEAAKLVPFLGVEPATLHYFLSQHQVRNEKIPAYIGGLWREESTEFTCANRVDEVPVSGGVSYQSHADIRKSHQRVIGGVSAQVPLAKTDVRPGTNELTAMMRRVRDAKPSADAAVWTVEA